jgi:NAD(P)-dependent dehydrogenase (short-subunit alcohol dehydrogenase family)
LDQIINTNLKGVVYALKYGLPAIAKSGGGGSIVACSSTAGHSVMFGSERMKAWGVYAASKAAVDMLVQYAAIEGAVHGTRVNAVGPGLVKTGKSSCCLRTIMPPPNRSTGSGI